FNITLPYKPPMNCLLKQPPLHPAPSLSLPLTPLPPDGTSVPLPPPSAQYPPSSHNLLSPILPAAAEKHLYQKESAYQYGLARFQSSSFLPPPSASPQRVFLPAADR